MRKWQSMMYSAKPAESSSLKDRPNSESKRLVEEAQRFVRKEVLPNAAKYDASGEVPWEIIGKAHGLGLMNVDTPKELGGLGLDLLTKAKIYQELSYGCSSIAASLMITELAQIPVLNFGSSFLKQRYVVRMLKEPLLAGYATTEENAGSDLASASMSAVEDGDFYVLNGTKVWVSNFDTASWFFVLARTSTTESTGRAFTGFIVDKDANGLQIGERLKTMGQKCGRIGSLTFDDVRVSKENIVGSVGKGFPIAIQTFERVRPLVASLACGIQHRALDEATRYSMQRQTFGSPIIQHQSVAHKLANIAQRLEASKLLAQQAAEHADSKDPNTAYFSSIAKCFATDVAVQTSIEAIQIFGANAYNSEFPVEKLMRDAVALQFMSGSNEIQRTIISRQLSRQHSKL